VLFVTDEDGERRITECTARLSIHKKGSPYTQNQICLYRRPESVVSVCECILVEADPNQRDGI
jgi:hypothetical protein